MRRLNFDLHTGHTFCAAASFEAALALAASAFLASAAAFDFAAASAAAAFLASAAFAASALASALFLADLRGNQPVSLIPRIIAETFVNLHAMSQGQSRVDGAPEI